MTSQKRKRNVLTIEQKLEAVERLVKGDSISQVALDLGVSVGTVADWRYKREDFENWCTKYATNEQCRLRKSTKDGDFEEVSEALFKWFSERREKGRPVDRESLKEKARALHEELQQEGKEPKKFYASNGWLNRWKSRYGLEIASARKDGTPRKPRRKKKRVAVNRLEDLDLRKIRGFAGNTTVSHEGAVDAFDTAILYLQQQDDAAANIEIALLRRLRDIAALKQNAAKSKKSTDE